MPRLCLPLRPDQSLTEKPKKKCKIFCNFFSFALEGRGDGAARDGLEAGGSGRRPRAAVARGGSPPRGGKGPVPRPPAPPVHPTKPSTAPAATIRAEPNPSPYMDIDTYFFVSLRNGHAGAAAAEAAGVTPGRTPRRCCGIGRSCPRGRPLPAAPGSGGGPPLIRARQTGSKPPLTLTLDWRWSRAPPCRGELRFGRRVRTRGAPTGRQSRGFPAAGCPPALAAADPGARPAPQVPSAGGCQLRSGSEGWPPGSDLPAGW